MTKRASCAITVLVSFLFVGCAATSLSVTAGSDLNPPLERLRFADPWEAMAHFDLTNPVLDSAHSCGHSVLAALRCILNGEHDHAKHLLLTIDSSADTICQKYARDFVGALLVEQGDWNSILEIQNSPLVDSETVSMARAFQRAPSQEFLFHAESDTLELHKGVFGLPSVDVQVNGKRQRFLLDTGASETILSSDIAQDCGVLPIGNGALSGRSATQDNLSAYPSIIDSIAVGRLLVRNHVAAILDESVLSYKFFWIFRMFKIDGIIGWRLLKNTDFTLDYNRRMVILREPRRKEHTRRNLISLGGPYVTATTDTGTPLLFFWDSGAQTSSLTSTAVQKLQSSKRDLTLSAKWSAGGSDVRVVQMVRELTAFLTNQRLQFKNMKITPTRDRFVRYDGILGNDVARSGIIRADATNGEFNFKVIDE